MQIFNELIGQVFKEVKQIGDELHFISETGKSFKFYHFQDCCESVYIDDICGDLSDLEGTQILMAEEVDGTPPDGYVTCEYNAEEWTFYKFATIKGYVDVRWFGTSNGYYSTSVYFDELD